MESLKMRYRPGSVVPSIHDNEWTFTYHLNGMEITHENWSNRTFKSAAAAKQAMRDFVEDMNK